MKTIEIYQRLLTDIGQLAAPVGIGCLIALGIGMLLLVSYGFSKVLEVYVTTKKRFEVLSCSVFVLVILGLLDLLIVYCYSHSFLVSHSLFYLLILLYFMAFYQLDKRLYRKVDILLNFDSSDYLKYLETLKVGDEVTVLFKRKTSVWGYHFDKARIIDKEGFSFVLVSGTRKFTFDPYVDYGAEKGNELLFIFPDTSYNLFLFELYKENRDRMVRMRGYVKE
ncbi:hypothetical protein ACVRXF_10440 [Streptococcus orisasini]